MKKLLLPVLLCTSTLLVAQSKKESFIEKFLYVKVSPTYFAAVIQPDYPRSEKIRNPAIFGALGVKMRYAAVGFSAGTFKLKEAGTVTPRGVDITLTDFKQKVFPVFTFQWHQAHFKNSYGIGGYATTGYILSGKDMYSIGAGGAFRVFKTVKMMTTVGLSRLIVKTTINHSSGPGLNSTNYSNDRYDMPYLAVSFVW